MGILAHELCVTGVSPAHGQDARDTHRMGKDAHATLRNLSKSGSFRLRIDTDQ
jgi:hypothetical protein